MMPQQQVAPNQQQQVQPQGPPVPNQQPQAPPQQQPAPNQPTAPSAPHNLVSDYNQGGSVTPEPGGLIFTTMTVNIVTGSACAY